MWCTKDGISHSYYEKPMRSHVLTKKRSSMPESSKFSILVNELNRRFEVMSNEISFEEKIAVIDKFTQQMVNSGYSYLQIREVIYSSLKGTLKKEERMKGKGIRRFLSS